MRTSITEYQKQVYRTYLKNNCSTKMAAIELGIGQRRVQQSVHNVKEYLEDHPDAVNEQEFKSPIVNIDDSLSIGATSTLYDVNGNVRLKWVKSNTSKNALKRAIRDVIDEYSHKLPKYEPQKAEFKTGYEKKLAVYPLADAHIGMLSWGPETGKNFNTKIAEHVIKTSITHMIDRTPACEECLILNLGDLLHIDNLINRTAKSNNVLDTDCRYAKIFRVGIRVIRYCIEYALIKHKKVTVINSIGNHDSIGELWLSAALNNIYENEKRVHIIDDPSTRHYYTYGNTLIGVTHGSDVKVDKLPLIMATEKPEEWGKSKFRYIYTGHLHHEHSIEVGDCKVEGFDAICARDAWATSQGYCSSRNMKTILIDPKYGETERFNFNLDCIDVSKVK